MAEKTINTTQTLTHDADEIINMCDACRSKKLVEIYGPSPAMIKLKEKMCAICGLSMLIDSEVEAFVLNHPDGCDFVDSGHLERGRGSGDAGDGERGREKS